jgi:hypothetical protein
LAFSGAFSAGGALTSAFAAGAGAAGAAGFAVMSSCVEHEDRANTMNTKKTPVIKTRLFIIASLG